MRISSLNSAVRRCRRLPLGRRVWPRFPLAGLIGLILIYSPSRLGAQIHGIWQAAGGGNWSTTGNWQGSHVPQNADDEADFSQFTPSGNATITVDAPETVGSLVFGAPQGASGMPTIAGTSANPLTLDDSSGAPTITVNAGDPGATIDAVLAGSLGFIYASAAGPDSGVTLSQIATYRGPTNISQGTFFIGASNVFPAATTVSIGDAAAGSTAAADLFFSAKAGLTLANPIVAQNATSGTLTLGGQNTSGVNTFASNITLGATANAGKSITLSAAAGGEVDFTGNIFANGSDTSAGITVSGPGTVLLSGANTFAGGTTVASGGQLFAASTGALGAASGNTVVQAGGSLTAYQIVQNSLTIHGTGTTAATAGSVTLVPSGSGSTGNPTGPNNVNYCSTLTSLSIDNNGAPLGSGNTVYYGTLDIGNNGLVIAYGSGKDPYASIDDMIRSGFDAAHWDGTGITSSLGRAAANSHTPLNIGLEDFTPGVGNFSNTTFIVFQGQTITTNAILVRLTYMDDIIMAGDLSVQDAASDALLFAANYGTGTTWSLGDLGHTGLLGSADALLFAANYNTGLSSLDGTTGNAAALAGALTAVPEPATSLLAGLGGIGICLLSRRRASIQQIAIKLKFAPSQPLSSHQAR